ncbi:uncharacterized protein SAPINGB_P002266 [Magnusiomyces paraingens]|uniref:Uncharacterized protein n=1 Tax=Magnusiomyces paraingens TaxID=2606893 RepID=A0A5E8BKY7_9ASCO|nr:uncharacterized protein SAPINGB_P002266 [Saprochaete ingens]VVT49431.1 unnamed protein product [Saprochaete ingens]
MKDFEKEINQLAFAVDDASFHLGRNYNAFIFLRDAENIASSIELTITLENEHIQIYEAPIFKRVLDIDNAECEPYFFSAVSTLANALVYDAKYGIKNLFSNSSSYLNEDKSDFCKTIGSKFSLVTPWTSMIADYETYTNETKYSMEISIIKESKRLGRSPPFLDEILLHDYLKNRKVLQPVKRIDPEDVDLNKKLSSLALGKSTQHKTPKFLTPAFTLPESTLPKPSVLESLALISTSNFTVPGPAVPKPVTKNPVAGTPMEPNLVKNTSSFSFLFGSPGFTFKPPHPGILNGNKAASTLNITSSEDQIVSVKMRKHNNSSRIASSLNGSVGNPESIMSLSLFHETSLEKSFRELGIMTQCSRGDGTFELSPKLYCLISPWQGHSHLNTLHRASQPDAQPFVSLSLVVLLDTMESRRGLTRGSLGSSLTSLRFLIMGYLIDFYQRNTKLFVLDYEEFQRYAPEN